MCAPDNLDSEPGLRVLILSDEIAKSKTVLNPTLVGFFLILFLKRIFEKVAPPAFTPFRTDNWQFFEKLGLCRNWICGILLSEQILISYDGVYYFKISHKFVPIPITNYTTNFTELGQARKLHKVKLSITIIIIEKPFCMYHKKWRAWQTINSYYQIYN